MNDVATAGSRPLAIRRFDVPLPLALARTSLSTHPFVVIDTETARGAEVEDNAACQVGIVRIGGGRYTAFAGLVDPRMPIDPEMTSTVHGIDDEAVAGAPTIDELFASPAIRRLVRDAIPIAFNAPFDRRFVPLEGGWICALRLLRHLDPDHEANDLQSACVRNNIEAGEAHDAGNDSVATARLVTKLMATYLEGGGTDDVDALRHFADSPIRFKKIAWGTYNGSDYDSLPSAYLNWILTSSTLGRDPDISHTVRDVLNSRTTIVPDLPKVAPRPSGIPDLRAKLAAKAASITL